MAQQTQSLADLKELTRAPEVETARASKLDAQGRAYATGRRKDAVARVWVKPGSGRITVNGRDWQAYFARPVLRMRAVISRKVRPRLSGSAGGTPAPPLVWRRRNSVTSRWLRPAMRVIVFDNSTGSGSFRSGRC